MRSNLGTSPLEIKCSSCGQQGPHEAIYTTGPILHLRCTNCRAVSAYIFEEGEETHKGHMRNAVLQDHAALMQHLGSQTVSAYSTTDSYTEGQYIEHPTFGQGYVLAILGPPMKMDVLFSDKRRLLVCGPGSTTGVQRAKSRQAQRDKSEKPAKSAKASRRGRPKRSDTDRESSDSSSSASPGKCPVCGHAVHAVNLLRFPDGRIVGCMHCK